MNPALCSSHICSLAILVGALIGACSTNSGTAPPDVAPMDGSASGSGGNSASGSGSGGSSGAAGSGNGGGAQPIGTGSTSGGPIMGGGPVGAEGGSGGAPEAGGGSDGGSSGAPAADGGGQDASSIASDASRDTGGGPPNNCNLPATVSFKNDVQPFLMTSCGDTGTTGCHVIGGASTMPMGGYNHAYDWITGLSHSSSCPEMPTPFRFQVVIAVINGANPPTCSKSPRMPPPGATGASLRAPLTTCQVAALQAWLNEPLVTQMHRADGISPTTPYPMPPFN